MLPNPVLANVQPEPCCPTELFPPPHPGWGGMEIASSRRITNRHRRQPKLPNFLYSWSTTSWRLTRRANNNNNNKMRGWEATTVIYYTTIQYHILHHCTTTVYYTIYYYNVLYHWNTAIYYTTVVLQYTILFTTSMYYTTEILPYTTPL